MHPIDLSDKERKNKASTGVILWSYLRALLQIAWLVVHTCIGGSILILECMTLKNRRFENWMLRFWGRIQLQLVGVRVDVRGAENIPQEGCLFLFTHGSYSDIYVTFGHIPRPFRFGAKIELFAIPVFGATMRAVGVLPIVRNNRDGVLKVYEAAIDRVRKGECFALAPEGTRQEEPVLGKFKSGPFIFAINAQMPLIPVILTGAHLVQPKGTLLMNVGLLHRTVRMDILPAISTHGWGVERVKDLREQTFGKMKTAQEQIQKEFLVDAAGPSQGSAKASI